MNRTYLSLFATVGIVLLIQSCAPETPQGNPTAVSTTQDTSPTPQLFQTQINPTTLAIPLDEFRSSEELNKDILQEVSFFPGGAGCGVQNIGISGRYCSATEHWPISLQVNGVFRVSDQGRKAAPLWWGEKFDSCYETFQFGDMVYFSAKGYSEDEEVVFTIVGPNNSEIYRAMVQKNVDYFDDPKCTLYATAPHASRSVLVRQGGEMHLKHCLSRFD